MHGGGWASGSSIHLLLPPLQQCIVGIRVESSAQVLNVPPFETWTAMNKILYQILNIHCMNC